MGLSAYLSLYHQELPIHNCLCSGVKFKRQLPSALRHLLQKLAVYPLPHASRHPLAQSLAVLRS